ncbi:MAG: DUF1638 domain-containing protein [Deltaproteobacteria bacterium]|nr:DUF1638 domain-containing protein [Deltaproteobacteria bacterium]
MRSKRRKLIVCKALAHMLEPLTDNETEIRVLDIGLHIDPAKLRGRISKEVADMEDEDTDILLGYGLCGRAVEGVVSPRSTIVLPKVDDCVGALLGSRQRHRDLLNRNAGCYFLEQEWFETKLNIFAEITRGLERIPPEKRESIVGLMLKHYNTIVLLESDNLSPENESLSLTYSIKYDMQLIRLKTDSGLLTRLINGPWSKEEFLVLPPGMPVPFF